MAHNLLLRQILETLTGETSPMMGNNEALRRIHHTLAEGEAGISPMMADNEAWRRILGAYQGEAIAGPMGEREAQRRIVGELLGELPVTYDEHRLLTIIAENITPLEPEIDLTAPTLLSSSIDVTGLILTRVFSEAVTGFDGFTLTATGGALTETYTSGDGTATIVSALSREVIEDEDITEDYVPGDVEDLAGNPLAEIADGIVVNGSEVELEGVPLNALQTFETSSDGNALTAAMLNAAELGDAWAWTADRDPGAHTYIETTGVANYGAGVVNVEGSTFTSGTRCIKFDHTEAASEALTPQWDKFIATPPEAITKCVFSGFVYFGATGASGHTHDHWEINASPYLVLQQQLGASDIYQGTAGRVDIETQENGGSTARSCPIAVDIGLKHVELWFNNDTGGMGLILRDASTLAFYGCSYYVSNDSASTPLTTAALQSYLTSESGYTLHDNFGRTWKDGDVAFPLFPLTDLAAPSSVVLAQTDVDTVTVTWDNENAKGTFKIEIHNGTSWSTLEPAIYSSTTNSSTTETYTQDGLTEGLTYKMRITSQMGTASSTAVESNTVLIDNGVTLLLDEGFEGSGTPSGWFISAFGGEDPDYTTSPIAGAHSLRLGNVTDNTQAVALSLDAGASVWGKFRVRFDSISGSFSNFFNLQDSDSNPLLQLTWTSDGAIHVLDSTGNTDEATVATVTTGVDYYFWVQYRAATTGSSHDALCRVWFATTDTKPADGSDNSAGNTNGWSSADVDQVQLRISANKGVYIYDDVQLADSSFE